MAPLKPDYSTSTVSTDGPITGPRWLHWLVKIITGLALALPFILWLHWLPALAYLPGFALVTVLHLVDLRWWHIIPVGASIRSWRLSDLLTADVAADSVLHWVSALGFFWVATFGQSEAFFGVICVTVAMYIVFMRNYPWAQP